MSIDSSKAKYLLVCRVLRNRILQGKYRDKLPPERDLAEEFHANPKTVQVAVAQLEALGLVRRAPRQGTFITASEPDSAAGRTLFVRLIAPRRESVIQSGDIYWSAAAYHFQLAAENHGLSVVSRFATSEDVVAQTVSQARNPQLLGTCILSIPVTLAGSIELARLPSPVVLADWELDDPVVSCVVFDNLSAGQLAGEHLIGLGHRRIAAFMHPEDSPSQRDRLEGLVRLCRQTGVSMTNHQVSPHEFASAVASRLRGPDRPTAAVFSTPSSAEAGCAIAGQLGLRVPQDLSIITFGGALTAADSRVFTSVAMKGHEMGEKAFRLLSDDRSFEKPRRELVLCHLVKGFSTAPPPAESSS